MAAARQPVTLLRHFHPRCFSAAAETPLQRSVRSAVESRDFLRIPPLLVSYSPNPTPDPESPPTSNPFSFLSLLPPTLAARLVGDLIRSFLPLRPRSLAGPALSSLLQSLLTNPNPSPNPNLSVSLSLAVLHPLLRSGLPPPPLANLALRRLWLSARRSRSPPPPPVAGLLSSLPALGLRPPDLPTLNYLLSSLPPGEAVAVLRGMPAAGVDPDRESYCTVIEASPAAEACVRGGEAVAAGRVVAAMAARGFVPYAGVRRRVVEGLAGIGQRELVSAVRLRLAEIGS